MKYGLHISTAGDLDGTPARAKAMGAEVMQIFAGSPRTWRPAHYTTKVGQSFQAATKAAGIEAVFIHVMYLVSPASPDEELYTKTGVALAQTLVNADVLGVSGSVTHLGSHKGNGLEFGLARIGAAIDQALAASQTSWLILENSAGAGGNIGNSLGELARILEVVKKPERVRVCLDTAHLLASGYEVRTEEGWDKVVSEFDRLIGLENLAVMHLNDSKSDLGSHVDRHENIGQGFIGEAGFRVILNHPKLRDVPGILEVPGMDGQGPDAANITKLRELTK